MANERFDILVAPFLSDMEKHHFEKLLTETNHNYQIYGRGNSYSANTEIMKYAKGQINISDIGERYPNFRFNAALLEDQSI